VSFYDWILSLHVLSAFAVAAALVLYSVLVFAGRRMTTLEQTRALFRLAPLGTLLILGGTTLVLIFGIVLSLDSDQFEIWDPWIIAAIVLWLALGGVGQRTGAYYSGVEARSRKSDAGTESEVLAALRASQGYTLHLATVAVFLLLLLDMIFKPGA
jgi:hypothetical protein